MIHNFIIVGEMGTQINNPSTGCAAGSYDNRTSTSITLRAGSTYTVQVNSLYSSGQYFSIWIDFNANFQFETTERVANILLVGTSNNAVSVVIPTLAGGATLGARRMRATVSYSLAPSPCQATNTYGETHDYTANIVSCKSLFPALGRRKRLSDLPSLLLDSYITYSQTFSSGSTSPSQCSAWTSFVSQLTSRPYNLLTIRGTFDTVGVTVTDPTVILNIATALRTSGTYGPVTSNSRSWAVGACGGGRALSASSSVCACTAGYVVRPCIGNRNWGGVNSATCNGPTQTMTVEFRY